MPLKLTCPKCGAPNRLSEPLPLAGEQVLCSCGQGIVVTYPDGIIDELKRRGTKFASNRASLPAASISFDEPLRGPEPLAVGKKGMPIPPPPPKIGERATSVPTTVDATQIKDDQNDPPTFGLGDRTVPSSRSPYGGLAGNIPEPDSVNPIRRHDPRDNDEYGEEISNADARTEAQRAPVAATMPISKKKGGKEPAKASGGGKKKPPAKKRRGVFGCLARLGFMGVLAVGLVGCAGIATAGGGYLYFSSDLPSVEALQGYEPATSTIIYDKNNEILGEIYEERRYVIPLDAMPDNVKNAFVSAEDANFWTHGGVDYMGIVRAVLRNAAKGKKAQGASTITQQVTRNFLLTRDKTIVRKIKEILLAWRIEDVYEKDHILYLYLNEIYLGSGAYGVEAASRVYFDKHVDQLTLAEAAMLAGLPPAPSTYSPHKNFTMAKERQRYVLDQMVVNGYIDQATADAAFAEDLKIVERSSDFLQKAPHFTELVRRYVVDKYGEEAVLHQGMQIHTTCDLKLQQVAQDALKEHVDEIDQRMGFRRQGLKTLPDDAAIAKQRETEEKAMKAAWAHEQDPAGRIAEPDESILTDGQIYEGVILEVGTKWVKVGIGAHEGVVPMGWSDWVYEPDPRRSWRSREAVDLTAKVDSDGDGKKDGPILRKGDIVPLKVVSASTKDAKVKSEFTGTPGADKAMVAVRLWQDPEVEATMMSFELQTGAVQALVGGADFSGSQFIRATQAYRQVGSTFKPFVYGAAIETKKYTAATVVADAPLAFATEDDFVWKPSNYSNDYVGNITLRKALALSKNTCTIRVLEGMDPGMNKDVVYDFARRLGIGGPPKYLLPADNQVTPENDHLCPWVQEETDSTICMDHYPPRTDSDTNVGHRAKLAPTDKHMCRACDLSLGLGSASLTMEELLRAYSVYGTGGKLVQPYFVEEVQDRHGQVLEKHEVVDFPQVIDPGVSSVVNWMLQSVVNEGTAAAANGLGVTVAGKTGTTNDEKDAWFVGMTPNIITGVWVGFDTPKSLGASSTGGRTALPIWIDYMKVAAPVAENRKPFKVWGDIEWAQIDEATGRKVTSGGRSYPFLTGTVPEGGGAAGQATLEDVTDL